MTFRKTILLNSLLKVFLYAILFTFNFRRTLSYQFRFNLIFLPPNVLTLSAYHFPQFIRNTLGELEANLLRKISVKTTSSLLLVENPLDIFNKDIEDEELEKLKDQLCFKMKNEKLLLAPGVLAGFLSLKQALKDKLNPEQTSKSKRRKQQSDSNVSSISSSMLSTQPGIICFNFNQKVVS